MSRKGEKKFLQCDKRMWRHGYSKDNVSQSAFFSLFLIVVLFFRAWKKLNRTCSETAEVLWKQKLRERLKT